MVSFNNQTIQVSLIKTQVIHTRLYDSHTLVSPVATTTTSNIYVPKHTHDHGSMTGLFDDDHPQYLTEQRGADLFVSLSQTLEDKTNAANVGSGTGLFDKKNGFCLEFKSLVAGTNVTISEDTINGTITIDATTGVATDIDGGTY